MYQKDAPDEVPTEREESERLRQSEQQGDRMDQPAVPSENDV
ncbi:MAG TPA: hypothetical protein VFE17_01530 [Candidatus Baltobacteraceae bacterium]|jgi:hypothetical protein|nr:hypothetical protein [Candidatus Baltobacteraceae bacterium]